MSIKGWTKLNDCQWRHDGVSVNNLLNIYVDDDTDKHASEHKGSAYKITYINKNSEYGEKTRKTLENNISTLKKANNKATEIMRNNPESTPETF